ncbi:DUF6934 family protein [Dyadobacter sp. BHUBP1]|uniref:DUF6934 family protein n=1 Tax=Dyadobacter sp. BHUBP1 TaxID=3424178 RepID=UPI003D3320A5
MQLNTYPLLKNEDLKSYYFWSTGPNGTIKKVIVFQLVDPEQALYNLAFGDLFEGAEILNDLVITNNGDTRVVLATVGKAVVEFLEDFPNATIVAVGSTPVRTRLYQINISRFINEILQEFVVEGYFDGSWELFEGNTNYDAFMLKKKRLN